MKTPFKHAIRGEAIINCYKGSDLILATKHHACSNCGGDQQSALQYVAFSQEDEDTIAATSFHAPFLQQAPIQLSQKN